MREKLKINKHKINKNFTIMLIPYSNGEPKKLIISYYTIYGIIGSLAFLLFMTISFYLIATNFKTKSVEMETNLNKTLQYNSELIKNGNQLNELVKEERGRADEIEASVSKEYEERIKFFEEKSAEFQQRLDELKKLKDEIYTKISQNSEDRQAISALVSNDKQITESLGLMHGMGGPGPEVYLDLVYEKIDSEITAQEETYRVLMDQVIKIEARVKSAKDERASSNTQKSGNIPSIWPVSGIITSEVGNRANPFGGKNSESHNGIDIAVSTGTKVAASGGGVVKFAGYSSGYGYLIVIDHGNGLESYYGHNSKLLVSAGQKINTRDVIALSGNTGRSTGPHVHFEIRQNDVIVNPRNYVK